MRVLRFLSKKRTWQAIPPRQVLKKVLEGNDNGNNFKLLINDTWKWNQDTICSLFLGGVCVSIFIYKSGWADSFPKAQCFKCTMKILEAHKRKRVAVLLYLLLQHHSFRWTLGYRFNKWLQWKSAISSFSPSANWNQQPFSPPQISNV